MLDYLVKHAVDNVWCSPEQDRQTIVRPKRLSPRLGSLGLQTVMWERVKLPTDGDYYHVFQIGHVHPILLGLEGVGNDWMRLDTIINTSTLMAEVYFVDGVVLPRTETWVRYDRHKNLIVAIEDTRIFRRLRDDGVYCRVYSNAFFESQRANASTEGTFVEGVTVSSESDTWRCSRSTTPPWPNRARLTPTTTAGWSTTCAPTALPWATRSSTSTTAPSIAPLISPSAIC